MRPGSPGWQVGVGLGLASGFIGTMALTASNRAMALGGPRARSQYRFVLMPIQLIPESLTNSVPLFLQRQCNQTLGGPPSIVAAIGAMCELTILPLPLRSPNRSELLLRTPGSCSLLPLLATNFSTV